jgi:hypothetical protein
VIGCDVIDQFFAVTGQSKKQKGIKKSWNIHLEPQFLLEQDMKSSIEEEKRRLVKETEKRRKQEQKYLENQ